MKQTTNNQSIDKRKKKQDDIDRFDRNFVRFTIAVHSWVLLYVLGLSVQRCTEPKEQPTITDNVFTTEINFWDEKDSLKTPEDEAEAEDDTYKLFEIPNY